METIVQAPFRTAAVEAIIQGLEDQIDALMAMPETPRINMLITSLNAQIWQLYSSSTGGCSK